MAQITVIIPAHNIENHLRHCLDTVLAQTEPDLEILCVDDGSTDGTPRLLAQYAEQDPRLRVLTQANAGPGAARNAGLAQATGEYVIFLDSDDWFEPALLEKLLGRARQTGADITICRGVEFDNKTRQELPSEWMLKTQILPPELVFSSQRAADKIFQFTYGWPWDKLYRTDFLRRTELQFPVLPHSEDVVFVFQSLAMAQKIAVVNEAFIHHRVHRAASVSQAARGREPQKLYQAVQLLEQGLKAHAVYQQYEQSFLNWALEFLIWNAANLPAGEARHRYYRQLKQELLPSMGFADHPRAYYTDVRTYRKYQLVRYGSYPLFSAVLTLYRRWKKA